MHQRPSRLARNLNLASIAVGGALLAVLGQLPCAQGAEPEARYGHVFTFVAASPTASPTSSSEQSKSIQQLGANSHVYTEEELIGTIPPNNDHEYPLRLASLQTIQDGRFLITLHRGDQRGDRLTIWGQVGDNRYRLLQTVEADEGEWIDTPTVFRPITTDTTFIYVLRNSRHFTDEFLFALDDASSEALPVEIEPLPKKYQSMLHPGETLDDTPNNFFIDNQPAKFEIGILH
jgi:hypothetical protein